MALLLDPHGAVAGSLGVSGHPEYLLVDAHGRPDGTGSYEPFEVLVRAASARS